MILREILWFIPIYYLFNKYFIKRVKDSGNTSIFLLKTFILKIFPAVSPML